jgi:hypothetical protein
VGLDHLHDLVADREGGLSEVIGSWNTIEIELPRSRRIASGSRSCSRCPSNTTSPVTAQAGAGGRSPMIASA